MNTRFLFPHHYKAIGWVLFVTGAALGLLAWNFEWGPGWLAFRVPAFLLTEPLTKTPHNFFPEICAVLCITGALLAACARERYEDEFIMRLRLDSLLWAVYVNYGLLILALLLTFEFVFLNLMVYSMFTPLVLFLLRFHYVLFRASRAARYAE